MDIQIIVHIVVDYFTTIQQWYIARRLCRGSKELITTKKYNDSCFGKCTVAKQCMICQHQHPDIVWLHYNSETIQGQITHCPNWYCRVSALRSMIKHYKEKGCVLLKSPWRPNNDCQIPRSDGSVSDGTCDTRCLLWRHNVYYVHTGWQYNGQLYTKYVPLTYYTEKIPQQICI